MRSASRTGISERAKSSASLRRTSREPAGSSPSAIISRSRRYAHSLFVSNAGVSPRCVSGLRPLEPDLQVEVGRRVDRDAFPRQVLLHPGKAELAAEPALLPAAERRLGLPDVVRVDPDVTCLQPANDPDRAVDPRRPHRGPESVADAVRDPDRLVFAGERKDGENRPEDLLPDEPRVGVDVRDDGRRDVEPVDGAAGGDPAALRLDAVEE